MTEIPPPPRDDDPERAADARLYEGFVKLGQRVAAERAGAAPPSRRRRPLRAARTVLASLAALLVLGGAALATKVFIVDDGATPIEHDPGKTIAQAPGDRRFGAARTKDPKNSTIWGVRIYYNSAGDTCVLGGVVLGGRLGELHDGKFKALPDGAPGFCHNMADHIAKTGRVYKDTAEPRSVLYGVADHTIHTIELTTADGNQHTIPIAPDGSFIQPLADPNALTTATLTVRGTTRTTTTLNIQPLPDHP